MVWVDRIENAWLLKSYMVKNTNPIPDQYRYYESLKILKFCVLITDKLRVEVYFPQHIIFGDKTCDKISNHTSML